MSKQNWTVSRWMSKDIKTLKPHDKLVDAFELMREFNIRHVLILDHGRLCGIVSERDVRQGIPAGSSAAKVSPSDYSDMLMKTRIEAVMTRSPKTIAPEANIAEAAEILARDKISALPVVSDGKLKGIITSEDLLWAYLEYTHGREFQE